MHSLTTLATALVASALLPGASAFWRMSCPSRLIQERIDPIISPGRISAHMHTVSGGNGFGFEMDYAQARKSTCSSCAIKQDMSAYWTPKLYFKAENGSFIGVNQAGDYNGRTGGMTVYYLQRPGPNNDKLHAFPPGFRMVAGNPFKRSYGGDFAADAVSFKCLKYDGESTQTNGFPPHNCPDGLRVQVFFPSCWDGKNLDSEDHKSHVSYPESGHYDDGPCPASHPVHLISIFYEVIYETGDFSNQWYGDGQPFVLAQGDGTGYGFHGDFVNGWDVPALQKAVDTCLDGSGVMENCPVFDFFTDEENQACKVPMTLGINVNGPMALLPGCNNVTYGPDDAEIPTECQRVPKIFEPRKHYSDMSTSGWKYIGCGIDDPSARTFTADQHMSDDMTVKQCTDFCSEGGFKYAGLEYSTQCFCSNNMPVDRAPRNGVLGNCNMRCGGDNSQFCGGGAALSVYETCSGSNCGTPEWDLPGGLPLPPLTRRDLNGRRIRGHGRPVELS